MIPEKIVNSLYCSLSKDNHVLELPITMLCGHCACRKCISRLSQPFRCLICNEECNMNVNQLKECVPLMNAIEVYLEDLFKILHKQFASLIPDLKEEIQQLNDRIDVTYEFIKGEIEIRVESLKSQLDHLGDDLKKELDEEKLFLKGQIVEFDSNQYENELKALNEQIEKRKDLSSEKFYKNQERVKELSTLFQEIKCFDYKVDFNESTETLKKSKIGYLNYNQRNYLVKRIKTTKPRFVDIEFNPYTLCILPNNKLLVSDFNSNRLLIYDKNFVNTRTVSSINNSIINAIALESNQKDRIYIGNYNTNSIMAVDFNFKLMQTYGVNNIHMPGVNTPPGTLFLPFDIKFHENFLYVCDFNNKRIIKLNLNLTNEAIYMVTYQPWQLKIANSTVCVRPSQLNMLYFYDLNASFALKYKYDTLYNGPICTLNSSLYFYQFNINAKKFTCYDSNGKFLEGEENTVGVELNNVSFHSHSTFTLFDNQYLVIGAQKKFVLI